jgi:hypothetical protein
MLIIFFCILERCLRQLKSHALNDVNQEEFDYIVHS